MRIELITSDRQSGILTIILTNRYSGVSAEAILHVMFQRVCSLYRSRTDILRKKPEILNH